MTMVAYYPTNCTSNSTTSIYPTWHNTVIYTPGIIIWPSWQDILSPTAITNSATSMIPIILQWPDWQDNISIPNIIQERIEAENARLEQFRREGAEAAERARIASERAKQILLDHLTPEQCDMVEKNGWFVIEGGLTGKKYKIKSGGVAGNIEELDDNGKMIAKYCCHLNYQYPNSDHHLAQKLMLEWDEEEFLRKANRTAVG